MNHWRRNGFTLIEVLIAITLLGIMVVLLFASLRIAAESWDAGESKIAEVNQKAVVYQFFKRHLTAIRPLPMLVNEEESRDAGDTQQVFQGLAQSLRFAAALPAASTRKGLQIFYIAPNPAEPSTIMVTLTPYRSLENDADAAKDEPAVLLEHVAEFNIAYFGNSADVDRQGWQEEWTAADGLPSLIKITIALEDGSYWPEMVFPLKITAVHSAETVADDEVEPDVDTP